MLKCPSCQNTVKLAGKSPELGPSAAAPKLVPAAAPSPVPPAALAPADAAMPVGSAPASGRALVSLPDARHAQAVSAVLGRLGYVVEPFDQGDEKILKLQQGQYNFVVASRNGTADKHSLYKIFQSLPPDIRRRVFVLLVGDEFQTGEGTQAFATLADMVLNPKDMASADRILSVTVGERRRLYQMFLDVEMRLAEALV